MNTRFFFFVVLRKFQQQTRLSLLTQGNSNRTNLFRFAFINDGAGRVVRLIIDDAILYQTYRTSLAVASINIASINFLGFVSST